MIKLRKLIVEIIAERMSFSDLMSHSDPARIDRSKSIPAKSLIVRSINDREAWKFSYKSPSDQNTTGLRHQGFVYFFKESIDTGDSAMDLDCSVDCSCPDYKYRWSSNNSKAGAGEIGGNSINKGNGATPQVNLGLGLCKHLISLNEYLKTKINNVPVDPEVPNSPTTPAVIPKIPTNQPIPSDDTGEPEQTADMDVAQPPTDTAPVDVGVDSDPDSVVPVDTQPTSQTPQEPDVDSVSKEVPVDGDGEEETEDGVNKKTKLKEETLDKLRISKILDELCVKEKVFIIKYHD